MKAVALTPYLPVTDTNAFLDVDLPDSAPQGRDLLVRVKAVSVNPVDAKVRNPRDDVENPPRVLGWDAAGVPEAVGPEAVLFKAGDAVYFSGDITRPGSDAQLQRVDARIVAAKPRALGFAEAAAPSPTTISAYEAFFDRLGIDRGGADKGQTVLIIRAGGGGVGAITIQLAKAAGLVVIAAASRPETTAWGRELSADHVINHREHMVAQVRAPGIRHVDHIAILTTCATGMRRWT